MPDCMKGDTDLDRVRFRLKIRKVKKNDVHLDGHQLCT